MVHLIYLKAFRTNQHTIRDLIKIKSINQIPATNKCYNIFLI